MNPNRGFTLIEAILAAVITAVIAAWLIPVAMTVGEAPQHSRTRLIAQTWLTTQATVWSPEIPAPALPKSLGDCRLVTLKSQVTSRPGAGGPSINVTWWTLRVIDAVSGNRQTILAETTVAIVTPPERPAP